MGSNSGFRDEMDALDLVINAMMAHEKRLDEISERLENVLGLFPVKREEEKGDKIKRKAKGKVGEWRSAHRKPPKIVCYKWDEFKARVRGAKAVAFVVEGSLFHIYSLVDGGVFSYIEELPEKRLGVLEEEAKLSLNRSSLKSIESLQFLVDGRLDCGLRLSIDASRTRLSEREHVFELRYSYDLRRVKEFISNELRVSQDKVVEGRFTY